MAAVRDDLIDRRRLVRHLGNRGRNRVGIPAIRHPDVRHLRGYAVDAIYLDSEDPAPAARSVGPYSVPGFRPEDGGPEIASSGLISNGLQNQWAWIRKNEHRRRRLALLTHAPSSRAHDGKIAAAEIGVGEAIHPAHDPLRADGQNFKRYEAAVCGSDRLGVWHMSDGTDPVTRARTAAVPDVR